MLKPHLQLWIATIACASLLADGRIYADNSDEVLAKALAYLDSQPVPEFKAGHKLPHLSMWRHDTPREISKRFAEDWGYALPLATLTFFKRVDGEVIEQPL